MGHEADLAAFRKSGGIAIDVEIHGLEQLDLGRAARLLRREAGQRLKRVRPFSGASDAGRKEGHVQQRRFAISRLRGTSKPGARRAKIAADKIASDTPPGELALGVGLAGIGGGDKQLRSLDEALCT